MNTLSANLRTLNRTILIVSILVVLVSFFIPVQAQAALSPTPLPSVTASLEISGYAWSENIGWISLNCAQGGAGGASVCATSNYKVYVRPDGFVDGWAWSENIGWIKFFDLPPSFPSEPGTVAADSHIDIDGSGNWVLDGWARACAATASGDCYGSLDPNGGGWDGWIALKGASFAVTFDATSKAAWSNSYAWGSDNIGWVSWAGAVIGSALPTTAGVVLTAPNDTSVGAPVDLQYTVTGSLTCVASNDNSLSGWNSAAPITVGSLQTAAINNLPFGVTTFTLTCDDGAGSTYVDTAVVDARYDIQINSFSASYPATVPLTGVYATVNYLFDISGIPPAASNIPYTLTVNGSTYTGFVTLGTNSVSVSNVPPLSLAATLRVDLPEPGVLPEDLGSTPGVDEDVVGNSKTYTGLGSAITFQPVQVSVTPDFGDPVVPNPVTPGTGKIGGTTIRFGDTMDINWTLQASYVATCSISGPGLPVGGVSVKTNSAPGNTGIINFNTGPLTSTTDYSLSCRFYDADNPLYVGLGYDGLLMNRNTYTVEVIPMVEER